jgi:hypothetical protein
MERRFYYCTCGQQATYNTQINGLADHWLDEIFEQAVRDSVLDENGRVLMTE